MTRRWWLRAAVAGALLPLSALAVQTARFRLGRLTDQEMEELYAAPLAPPHQPLHVFHLGHSLVGRDMPAMLAQLAPIGHRYESQIGWGTSLMAHWDEDEPIAGFEAENAHSRFREAREAVGSADYDALILTEMVEIRDAIRYFESWRYLREWAQLARDANPGIRLYLYETWHRLDDQEGWLNRLDRDLDRYWDREILRRAMSEDAATSPIYVIPAGQVLARVARLAETQGGTEGLQDRKDLFARTPDGSLDPIHLNDLGNYLVALTHFAVLYHRSPMGLPHVLRRADGTPATPPSPAAARLMQEAVWDVVTSHAITGVPVQTS